MPCLRRNAIRESALFPWKSSLPWFTRLKGGLCSHLRFLWMALMALTLVCVAQILGVAWQSRNTMNQKQFATEKLSSMKFLSSVEFEKTLTMPGGAMKQGQLVNIAIMEYRQQGNKGSTVKGDGQMSEKVNVTPFKAGGGEWNSEDPQHKHRRERLGSAQISQSVTSHRSRADKGAGSVHSANGKSVNLAAAQTGVIYRVKEEGVSRSVVPVVHGTGILHPPPTPVRTVGFSGPQKTRPSVAVEAMANEQPDPKNKELTSKTHSLSRASLPPLSTVNVGNAVAETTSASQEVAKCKPKTHIVFLKTHKTASSTILNILYRYGDSRNLTFALPLNKHSQLFYPLYFAANFVEGFRSKAVQEYNIMCNHMRFMPSEVKKIMPEDTFYFSILRNPVSMMESIFMYYKSIPAFHKVRKLDDFLSNPRKFYNASLTSNHYAKNLLTFDFGFNNNNKNENVERQINLTVSMIEKNFNLILISEYFDESMILLKNALCWTLDDVISFKLNSRSNTTRQQLSSQTMEKIKRWNSLDWKIYLHFNMTFWRKVDLMVGREKMRQEVGRLQERRRELMKTCLMEGGAVDPSQVKDQALKPFQYGAAVIQGYNLNPHLDQVNKKRCQDLITPELQYTAALYTKQFPKLAAKLAASQKMAALKTTALQRRNTLDSLRVQGYSAHPNVFHNGTVKGGVRNVP